MPECVLFVDSVATWIKKKNIRNFRTQLNYKAYVKLDLGVAYIVVGTVSTLANTLISLYGNWENSKRKFIQTHTRLRVHIFGPH